MAESEEPSLENIPTLYRVAKVVADGLLAHERYDPTEVYTFLATLEGHPEIVNVTFINMALQAFVPAVKAEYSGNLPWGGENGLSGVANDEFQATAESIGRLLEEHTGYDIASIEAYSQKFAMPAKVVVKAKVGHKTLPMIITKAERSDS